jgi:hypothetical protein
MMTWFPLPKKRKGINELIGAECDIEYIYDHGVSSHGAKHSWPQWATILDVDMPLIKLKGKWTEELWINTAFIKEIKRLKPSTIEDRNR